MLVWWGISRPTPPPPKEDGPLHSGAPATHPKHHHDRPYHVRVFSGLDGWYLCCPEHGTSLGTGPFKTWAIAMTVVGLHLRNFNHY